MELQDRYHKTHMQTRSSIFQNKASKIFQRVSILREKLRIGKNNKMDNEQIEESFMNMSPIRQTRSMDLDMQTKPYMSSPMLAVPSMPMPMPESENDRRESGSSPRTATFTFSNRFRLQTKKPSAQEPTERCSTMRQDESVQTDFSSGIRTASVRRRGLSMDGMPNMDISSPSYSNSGSGFTPERPQGRASSAQSQPKDLPQMSVSSPAVPQAPYVGAAVVSVEGLPRTSLASGSPQPVASQLSSSHSSPPIEGKETFNLALTTDHSTHSLQAPTQAGPIPPAKTLELKQDNHSVTTRPTTSGSTLSTSSGTTVMLSDACRDKVLPEAPIELPSPPNLPTASTGVSSAASSSDESEDSGSSHASSTPHSNTPDSSTNAPSPSHSPSHSKPTKSSSIVEFSPNAKSVPSGNSSTPFPSRPLPAPPPQVPHLTTSPGRVPFVKRPSTSPTTPLANSLSLPSRHPRHPRLTMIMPGNKFNLAMSEGESASARFSPSIIIRQPTFPILPLPTVKVAGELASGSANAGGVHGVSASEGAHPPTSFRRDSLTGMDAHHARMESHRQLRHMPSLPMAGPNNCEEEEESNSDMEEMDDFMSDEEMEMDMDMEQEAEIEPETTEGEDEDDEEHRSINDSAPSVESHQSDLPMIDISRVDWSFLDRPPGMPATNVKGKGKAHSHDPRKTPIQMSKSDYFSMTHGSAAAGPSSVATRPQTPSAKTPRPMDIPLPLPMTPRASHIPMAMTMNTPLRMPGKPGLYKHASRSMIDIPGLGMGLDRKKGDGDEKLSTEMEDVKEGEGMAEDGVLDHAGGIKKVQDGKPQVEVPSVLLKHKVSSSHFPTRSDALNITEEPREPRIGSRTGVLPTTAPPHASQEHPHPQTQVPIHVRPPASSARPSSAAGTLLRRRSMPTFNASSPPPPYPSFLHPNYRHISETPPNLPPSDDDHEPLPPYSNSLYLRAIMPRKMEFSKPGVQAKDRKWRRVICELEGTVFRVYRCPPPQAKTKKVVDWWERRVGVGDVSLGNGVGGVSGTDSTTVGISARTSGPGNALEQQEEYDRLRAEKLAGERGVISHTEILLPNPRDRCGDRDSAAGNPPQQPQPPPTSRSRLVNLLKPHHRSQSDVMNAPKSTGASRSSFNLPRPSFGGSSTSVFVSGTEESTAASTSATSNRSLNVSIPSSTSIASSQGAPSASRISTRSGTRTPATSASVTSAFPPGATCMEPDKNDLIKAYTLQNAESGLGNDYFKRKNVIRVRMEGEQFLLQARDVSDVVGWIEGLQAATNIALDLDERVMPRGPLFPRRRRRRVRRVDTNDGIS